MRKSLILSLAAWLVVAAVAGCGGAAPSAPSAPKATVPVASTPAASTAQSAPSGGAAAAQLTPATLRLPWIATGYDAPFVLAEAKGYYKQAGFNVKVEEGKGSAITGQTVGNGSDTFGVIDAGTAALMISKGVPIQLLAVYVQKSPVAFIYDQSHPFASPKDLAGRPVMTSAGNAALTELPAVLATAGMQMSQIKITIIQPQSFATELKTHPDAVVLGVSISDFLSMHKVDPAAAYKLYADFGPNVYGFGLITDLSRVENDAGAVGRFVAATEKGWSYAQQHPAEAAQALVAAFPQTDPALAREGLDMSLGLVHTQATQQHPLGWMAQSDWQQSIDILEKYGNLGSVKPLADYYTNKFVAGT